MIEHIIISETCLELGDDFSIVQSNSAVVDALLQNYVLREELSVAALKSYYIHFYDTCMNRGGFAEFVVASGWERTCIEHLVSGLENINAHTHIELLGRFTNRLSTFGADGVACLYDDDHPQNKQMREFLNELMPDFISANMAENLMALNAKWLKNHPALVIMSELAIGKQIEVSSRAVPNRTQRMAKALALEPRHMKLIRLLCDVANLDFLHLTPTTSAQGEANNAKWHFQTEQGAYYFVDQGIEAAIYDRRSEVQAASVKIEDVELTA